MGCDSHPHIEIKGKTGKWKLHDEKYHYYDENESYEEREKRKPSYMRVLGSRNYIMFSVLADVRNGGGWGFHEEKLIKPLFAGRGTPADVTKATMKHIPRNSDYHSYTHFTVAELVATNWDAVAGTKFETVIYAADFGAWKEHGTIPPYAREIAETFGEATREVSHEEMVMLLLGTPGDELTKMVPDPFGQRNEHRRGQMVRSGPYVKVHAPKTYRQLVPSLVECIPDLVALGDPEKTRIVIAFDN